MVNFNGNYGVNPSSGVGGYNSVPYNTNSQPQVNNNFNNYTQSNDSYAFNLSTVPTGPVPDVKVGLWDKVTTYFKDVHNSPENLQRYVAFENAMETNPQGYLKPGSSDSERVSDLQKKLSFVGISVNVNGEFGPATERAVIEYKRSIGLNDGYLNKDGNFAVTGIVTPQTWNVLNSQVATRLNPGADMNSGFAPPVTQTELDWANELANKIRMGYNPSQTERMRYENIFQRQQMSQNVQNGTFNPVTVQPPSPTEVQWAKDLVQKMNGYGYKPNAQEVQKYQDIYQRQQLAKQQQSQQPQQSTENPGVGSVNVNGVTQEELAWAQSIMQKVAAGQSVTPDEEIRYNDILLRYQASQGVDTSINKPSPVTQAELMWAQDLEKRVNTQGYTPNDAEKAKYEDIFSRYQAEQQANANPTVTTNPMPSGPVQKPSDQEIAWAMELERKTKEENYQPKPHELEMYNDVVTRLEQYAQSQQQGSASGGATPQELAWAAEMYNKMQQGYQPTQEERAILANIQSKVLGGGAGQTNPTPTGNNPSPSAPVNNGPDFGGMSVFEYNSVTIAAFRSAFQGVSFQGNSIPYLPTSVGNQVANQYGFGSVSELQSAVGASVDGKFGPETYFKLMQSKGTSGASPTGGSPANGVTQAELDWAMSVQSKYGSGQQLSQDEIARYTDIYNRYEASGKQVVSSTPQQPSYTPTTQPSYNTAPAQSTAPAYTPSSSGPPTQQELQWASNLQAQINSGHQPTQSEIAQYTDIYNRYQASGGATAVGNTQPTYTTNTQPAANTGYTTSNTPSVSINASSGDPDLQWALQLLDKIQQGYRPTDQEVAAYEQVIARNQSVVAYP